MKKMLCNTYFLVFSIMVFVAALTWFVPSGQYDRVEADGRTYAVGATLPLSFRTGQARSPFRPAKGGKKKTI